MKKYFYAAMAAFGLLLTSCSKESSYHALGVVYPSSTQPALLYADQVSDSLLFYTTDNFQISVKEATWIQVPDSMKSGNITNYYRTVFYVPVYLTFEANTSGKPRTGNITIRSYDNDDWDNIATAAYYQVAWHNVLQPAPTYQSGSDGVITSASFKKTVAATQETDTIVFHAYGKWTLTDGGFIHVEKGLQTGGEGEHVLPVTLDVNATTENRTSTLVLSSNGVSTPIEYTQEAPETE